jgi:ABC transport system ATP-binding/permease protein
MPADRRWIIGRVPGCDIVVPVAEVSSRHCELSQTPTGFTLSDLGSSNGTFVNGARLGRQAVPVSRSDTITLGVKTPFPWPPDAPIPAAPRAATPPPLSSSTAGSRVIAVGRLPDNDVVLNYPMISGKHARVIVSGGRAEIEDLGSSNGIAIGDPTNRVRRAPLTPVDMIFFGSLRVPASRLLGAAIGPVENGTRRIEVTGRDVIFGRRADCDQVLDYPMISGQHARLRRTSSGMIIEDLQSANGTFVNGWRIAGPTPVKEGDVIGLGTFSFTLKDDAGHLEGQDLRASASLEARNVTFKAANRTLIEGVSFTALGGEFVGLMGPSGAGKTTLMNTLNGYTLPSAGRVLINGHDLYQQYDQFRHCLGYVPQEDVMHRDLTVGQALFYSARLRLPEDYTTDDIRQRVTAVLDQLGLAGTENVLIGSAEKKGISGGQRKRVNLAMELLTDPLILFLDEPTSGLSSEDALLVMKVLKGLADQGKVIILTIHQPSLEVYQHLDHLLVVAKDPNTSNPGVLTYFGPAYPDAIKYFNPEGIKGLKPGQDPSPDEVLRGLKNKPAEEWNDRYNRSDYWSRFVEQRAGTEQHEQPPPPAPRSTAKEWFMQLKTLTVRALQRKLADRIGTGVLLVQAPAFAILLWLVFGKSLNDESAKWMDKSGWVVKVIFQMTLAAIWFGCSNSIRDIVGEWAVYKRERMVNLKIIPYVASKFTVLGALCIIQCVILLGVVHFGCSLHGNLILTFFLMLLASMVGVAMGLVLSAASKTTEIAIGLLPLVQLTMVVLGGGMQEIHQMPWIMRAAAQTMPSRWAFEGALLMEVDDREKGPAGTPMAGHDMAERPFPNADHRTSALAAFLVLMLMFCLFTGSVLVILRLRDVH